MSVVREAGDSLPESLPALPFDEPSQPDSRIEWWFFHGRFGGEQVEERYFMASIFRTRFPDQNDQTIDGFSALISVLDPATGHQLTSSRVDRSIVRAPGPAGRRWRHRSFLAARCRRRASPLRRSARVRLSRSRAVVLWRPFDLPLG